MLMRAIKRWRKRIRIMVRYRLLALVSIPMLLTLLALIAVTLYWTVSDAWNKVLASVEADLAVASNSMLILQREQRQQLKAIVDSYDFQMQIRKNPDGMDQWAMSHAKQFGVDYLSVYSVQDIERLPQSLRQPLLKGWERTFFQLMSEIELQSLDLSFSKQARIKILEENLIEVRGLISRSLLPVYDSNGDLAWIIDGIILLNGSTWLVDSIRDLVYPPSTLPEGGIGTVTLFLGDLRVSTNVPLDTAMNQGRAIGTRVSEQVKTHVLEQGEVWINRAYVHHAWYISAYKPIRDFNNRVIGMLYIGFLEWPLMRGYIQNMIELGIVILVILWIFGFYISRAFNDFFAPLDKIQRVVRLVRFDKKARIGKLPLDSEHELAILARQFDSMLDQLDHQNEAILRNALELETKVAQRTASLHEKTEQLEANIQLLEKTRNKLLINEKFAALGELTAGIAHEINNPAAVILGNIELIEYALGNQSEQVVEELEAVKHQIERMKNITSSLLQYSRQGAGQDQIIWQYVNPIIEESIVLVRSGTKKNKIQIETYLNARCRVEINRHQLLQILVNLQMNGIHAMGGQGKLVLRSADWIKDQQVCGVEISIQDFGSGIEEQYLSKIFDPFFTTKPLGTGLGLSLTQGIIRSLGGDIKVITEMGQGTIFNLYLNEKIPQVKTDLLLKPTKQ